jgi:hypothetical protein
MPYVPGHEEDGFLKKLDITPTDIEPKADRCTQVRTLYLMKKYPFWLINLNNEFMSHGVDGRHTDSRLAHADQIQQPG